MSHSQPTDNRTWWQPDGVLDDTAAYLAIQTFSIVPDRAKMSYSSCSCTPGSKPPTYTFTGAGG